MPPVLHMFDWPNILTSKYSVRYVHANARVFLLSIFFSLSMQSIEILNFDLFLFSVSLPTYYILDVVCCMVFFISLPTYVVAKTLYRSNYWRGLKITHAVLIVILLTVLLRLFCMCTETAKLIHTNQRRRVYGTSGIISGKMFTSIEVQLDT